MNILSLFAGISCGQVALEKANIKMDKEKFVLDILLREKSLSMETVDLVLNHVMHGLNNLKEEDLIKFVKSYKIDYGVITG